MSIDGLYARAPVAVQGLGVALYGAYWYRRRFGSTFRATVPVLRARDSWTAEQWRDEQSRLLRAVLEAASHAPYYRDLFRRHGVELGQDPFAALAMIPTLSKQVLREQPRALLTQTRLPRGTAVFRSSGTTGTPTEIYFAHSFHQVVQAFFEARNRNWAGVTYRDRRAMFGVRKVAPFDQVKPPFWRRSPVEHLAYMSIYHLSPRFMPDYIEFLNRFRPAVIMGYPSALSTLAQFALAQRRELHPARAIITTSETVTEPIREAVERAWGTKISDNYSAVEACMLATQCEHGRYHVSPDFGVVEILDEDDKPCPPGVVGRAVCTGLNNHLQPLIRYEVGDALAWSEERSCPCGRDMPMLRSIEGRIEDMCTTADGRRMLRFDTVFKGVETIREAQVVQEDVDHFVVRVVPTPEFSQRDREVLSTNMRKHVGEVRCEVVTVSSIERSKSGKFRPVISRLHERAP